MVNRDGKRYARRNGCQSDGLYLLVTVTFQDAMKNAHAIAKICDRLGDDDVDVREMALEALVASSSQGLPIIILPYPL